jgi:hypothetical protein
LFLLKSDLIQAYNLMGFTWRSWLDAQFKSYTDDFSYLFGIAFGQNTLFEFGAGASDYSG